jgi:lysophospholipid acyltransferase (LPLAT)-like uncharacterized protein
VAAPALWLYSRTWRIEEHGDAAVLLDYPGERRLPCVYAHWHRDELVLLPYYAHRRLAVLASLSRDGSMMAESLELLGYRVFRGSSSRGGARGLIRLIRAVRTEGLQAALAVDGPKGPIYEVKPGIVTLALKTGLPIIPVVVRTDRAWPIRGAWNRSYIAKPFARITAHYGTPIVVQEGDDVAGRCVDVKRALESMEREAVREAARA